MTGKIKRVLHTRGFGFVIDEQGAERFLHVFDMAEETDWPKLKTGQVVEFTPCVRRKAGQRDGLGCQNVKVLPYVR